MRLEEFSIDVNSRLLECVETQLSKFSRAFREEVLYAVSITAPLRERTYLVRIAAEVSHLEWEAVEPFALAAELFMISALTADDVIDGSVQRSGKPTLVYKTDSARAFLVAECLHGIAQSTLWNRASSTTEDIWKEAASELRLAFIDLLFHQHLQSSLEGDVTVSCDQIDRLARGRTGRLIEACLIAPATLRRLQHLKESLSECGRWLGMAFQHRDDILDFIGTPEVMGKPILLDILNGQPNIVLSHVLTAATDQSSRSTVLKYFGARRQKGGARRCGEGSQQEIISALRTSGSLAFASALVRDYCDRAVKALDDIPSSQAKEELIGLIGTVASVEFPWEGA